MPKEVAVMRLDNDAREQRLYGLSLVDGVIIADGNQPLAKYLLGRSLPAGRGEVLTAADGERFLESLHQHYSGSRMWATRYEERSMHEVANEN